MSKQLTQEDLLHLKFIYERLRNVHNESPNVDYMVRFRTIIAQSQLHLPLENHAGINTEVYVGNHKLIFKDGLLVKNEFTGGIGGE